MRIRTDGSNLLQLAVTFFGNQIRLRGVELIEVTRLLALVGAVMLCCALAPAQSNPATSLNKTSGAKARVAVPPEKAKPIHIPRFDKPPVIDGKLDDEVWKEAAVLKDFYQINPG